LSLLTAQVLPDVTPVFWLLELEEGVANWARMLEEQYPERVLVPFAKDRRTDDLFCFEGNDLTGNPAVILIHSFADPGWEYRGAWSHFDSWYRGLLAFHRDWIRTGDAELDPPKRKPGP